MTLQLKKLGRNDGTSNDMVQGKSTAFPPEELASLLEQQLSALGDPDLHTREMAIAAVVRLGVRVPARWVHTKWGHPGSRGRRSRAGGALGRGHGARGECPGCPVCSCP
jgi:hypothetical protein